SALVLAYILVLELALRRSDRRSPWLILSGLSILMAYTHYFAWLFIAAIAPAVLLRKDRRALWRWVLTAAVAALCLLPWILYSRPAVKTAGGIQTVLAWVPTPTLRSLAELFARYTGAAGSVTSIALSCAAGFFFCAVAFLGRRRSPANPNLCSPLPAPVPSFLWLTVLAPPLFLFLLSLPPLNYPVWGIRHLLPGQAVWAILLASGAAGFFPRRRGAFAAAMIILACLQAVPMVDSLRSYWFEPYHRVARVIKSEIRTREFPPLFLFSESAGSIMRFYLEGELNLRLIPAGDEGFPLEWMAVYRPAEASEAGRIMRFLDKGYSVVWSRDFIKRPGDPRGLRLVFLRK
ncbi:MAG: hypothetical protein JW843_01310, partial [Candidatus Aminicenantes bacterium]|nr:hypothetical protein [Candidatus Aminicenantes bacterium]